MLYITIVVGLVLKQYPHVPDATVIGMIANIILGMNRRLDVQSSRLRTFSLLIMILLIIIIISSSSRSIVPITLVGHFVTA